ncbi:hypothetical protein [Jiangella alkaliphila]|uniref:DUF4352 domain-containing protein n=1 Tax=Jiangella alkaliphila TaxID=419479 RepID=A0A1H2LDY3_9ACTN|nr:hypothetical protein [Jiangella alkaliphila]SDU78945.1 hypothetical protein SAMN04488563_5897 [Jiangella alkaliphila]
MEEFVPTEFAAFEEAPAYVRFTVTITNGTGQPFDPSTTFVTVSSGGAEASAVFDEGLEGAPLTPVLPGESVSWMEGFAVTDPADLVCQVTPSFDHLGELFVGGL